MRSRPCLGIGACLMLNDPGGVGSSAWALSVRTCTFWALNYILIVTPAALTRNV